MNNIVDLSEDRDPSSSGTKTKTSGEAATSPTDGDEDDCDGATGDLDSSGLFSIREKKSTTKGKINVKVVCNSCNLEVWLAQREAHIATKHRDLLELFMNKKRKVIGKLQKKLMDTERQQALMDKFTVAGKKVDSTEPYLLGTLQNLHRQIAVYLLVGRLPLRTIDTPHFRDMIQVAFNLGVELGQQQRSPILQLCKRDKLVEDFVEGEDGLLNATLEASSQRHLAVAKQFGASLCFDGAKDANGVSIEVVMLQTVNGSSLQFAAHPHTNPKDHTWIVHQIRGVVEKTLDFDAMCAADSSPIMQQPNFDVADKRTKTVPSVADLLTKTYELAPYVWAAGGDNASTPVKAVYTLLDELGIIPFGDVSHAFARAYVHLCKMQPFNETVEAACKIVDLFLSYGVPRALLRDATKDARNKEGKSLKRLVETRFVSAAAMLERLLKVKDALQEVIAKQEFKGWRSKQSVSIRGKAEAACAHIVNDDFWLKAELLNDVSLGFIVSVRLFDGAVPGSACMVNKVWNMLADTVARALCQKEKYYGIVSRAMFRNVKHLIEKDWENFHFPVFAAAYLGCVHFRDEIVDLLSGGAEDEIYLHELKNQTIDVGASIFRRFNEVLVLRESVLDEDDNQITCLKEELMNNLDDYLLGTGVFATTNFKSGLSSKSPAEWWAVRAPPCPLKHIMKRICALAPATTPVERMHKVFHAVRTKGRNRLGYSRSFGLTYVAAEYTAVKKDRSLDWSEIMKYKTRFEELSEHDRAFLDAIEDAAENEVTAERFDEEECINAVHLHPVPSPVVNDSTQTNPPNSTNNDDCGNIEDAISDDSSRSSAEGSDNAEGNLAEANVPAIPIPAALVSSRGRIVRRKTFEGYEMGRWG